MVDGFFLLLSFLQFTDVPEDWCESATEFTEKEKLTSKRHHLEADNCGS